MGIHIQRDDILRDKGNPIDLNKFPEYVGQLYIDTTDDMIYMAAKLSVKSWKALTQVPITINDEYDNILEVPNDTNIFNFLSEIEDIVIDEPFDTAEENVEAYYKRKVEIYVDDKTDTVRIVSPDMRLYETKLEFAEDKKEFVNNLVLNGNVIEYYNTDNEMIGSVDLSNLSTEINSMTNQEIDDLFK